MARQDAKNRAQYWRDVSIPGLTLMSADFTTQEFSVHAHDALVIAATEIGGAAVKSRGIVQTADEASLFVFNPTEPHSGWMGDSPRWRYRSLYLTQSALDVVAEGLDLQQLSYFTANRIDDTPLVQGFLNLHQSLLENTEALRQEELLLSSFGRLFRRHGGDRRSAPQIVADRRKLKPAMELMQDSYGEALCLDDLVAVTGLQKFQLISLFKRVTGMGPYACLTQIRLNEACHRLKRGEALADIAAETGFYDQSAMNRHFKRAYGITPLQYARAA